MSSKHVVEASGDSGAVSDGDDDHTDEDVVDLTDPANQNWMNDPGPSWTRLRDMDSDERGEHREEMEEKLRRVQSSE